MSKLNDHDRLTLQRHMDILDSPAHHDGVCGVRITLNGQNVALATTAMSQSLSVPEQKEVARRLALLWNLCRHVPTNKLETMIK